jgi:hypothetical protein
LVEISKDSSARTLFASIQRESERARACLTAHEDNHIISEAMTTIAR